MHYHQNGGRKAVQATLALLVLMVGLSLSGARADAQTVLVDMRGSGSARSEMFNAPDGWELTWSFDCSRAPGGTGQLIVGIREPDDSPSRENNAVIRRGPSGQGVERDNSGGQFFLSIESSPECSWAVRVTVAQAAPTTTQPTATTITPTTVSPTTTRTVPPTVTTVPAPVVPPSPTTTTPRLPKTGPPSPYTAPLAVVGVLLFLLGWWLYEKGSWSAPISRADRH